MDDGRLWDQAWYAFLSPSAIFFDLSVFSIYPALVSGGMLKPLNKAVVQDFRQLFATLPALKLNVGFYSIIYGYLLDGTYIQWRKCAGIGHVLFCGEELTKNCRKST